MAVGSPKKNWTNRLPTVEPCPVDCIDMIPVETGVKEWKWELPAINASIIATDRDSQDQPTGKAA